MSERAREVGGEKSSLIIMKYIWRTFMGSCENKFICIDSYVYYLHIKHIGVTLKLISMSHDLKQGPLEGTLLKEPAKVSFIELKK